MVTRKDIANVIEIVLETNDIKSATKYVSPKLVVRATRFGKPQTDTDIRLKIGRPNYTERKFIKKCEKAEMSFPIKNIQIRWRKKINK